MQVELSRFLLHVRCFIRFVRLYVSQKDLMCGSFIPTLKSPKINIFLDFEECNPQEITKCCQMVLYHSFMRIIGTIIKHYSFLKFSSP